MRLVNPLTAYPIGQKVENINNVPMRGWPEKQGWSFSRHGYTHVQQHGGDADAIGAAMRSVLRPLSKPTLAKARVEYAAREARAYPRYFIIEPSASCNRKCPFCPIIVTKRKGFMKWRHFTKLMGECGKQDVYGISLYQLGESMLWRDHQESEVFGGGAIYRRDFRIKDMVEGAKFIGGFKAVNLSTNGDVSNLDTLLDSGLDDLIISIDGLDQETYEANRPSTKPNDTNSYERTVQRVRDFLAAKVAGGHTTPFCRLQIINKENTADSVLDFVRAWIDVPGVDDVFCKNLDSMRPWLNDSVVSDEEDAIKALQIADMPCQHIYTVGSMVADGRFNACAHDARTELTTRDAHIDKMSFADWWNSDYMTRMRRQHETGVFHSTCASCRDRDSWLG